MKRARKRSVQVFVLLVRLMTTFSGLNTSRKVLVNAKKLTQLECTSDRKNSIRKTNSIRESKAKIPNFYIKYTTKREIPVCFKRDHLLHVNYSNPYTSDR